MQFILLLSLNAFLSGKGFNSVRKAWLWQKAPLYESFPTGPLTLAQGSPGMHQARDGRYIVLAQLKKISRPLLLELGVFLGGSSYRWLDGAPTARVVGVDPFFNVTDYISNWVHRDRRYATYRSAIAQLAPPRGSYNTAVAALWLP